MGRCEPHCFPTYEVPGNVSLEGVCLWTSLPGHCLYWSPGGCPSLQGLLIALRVRTECFTMVLEVQHVGPVPLSPSFDFPALFALCTPASHGLPTSRPLHVLYPLPDIFSSLPTPSPPLLPNSYLSFWAWLGLASP